MDFLFTPAQEAFRSEVRGFLGGQLPSGWHGHLGDTLMSFDDEWQEAVAFTKQVAARAGSRRTGRRSTAAPASTPMRAVHLQRGDGLRARAPSVGGIGRRHGRPDADPLRHARSRSSEHLPQHHRRRGALVPGLLRAGRRLRPGQPADPRRARRRRLRDQRPEDLDLRRARADWMFLLARTDPDAPKHRGISHASWST